MSLFETNSAKRHREIVDARATCLRCRRQYTLDPDADRGQTYCWWCAVRVGILEIGLVRE